MEEQIDNTLSQFFKSGQQPKLPSNFAWQVMQRIQKERISKATHRAHLESLVIGFIAILCAAALLAAYSLYVSIPVSTIEVPVPAMVSAAMLFGFWIIDTALRVRTG